MQTILFADESNIPECHDVAHQSTLGRFWRLSGKKLLGEDCKTYVDTRSRLQNILFLLALKV